MLDGIPTTILDPYPKVRPACDCHCHRLYMKYRHTGSGRRPSFGRFTKPTRCIINPNGPQIQAVLAKVAAHPKVAAWNEAHGQK